MCYKFVIIKYTVIVCDFKNKSVFRIICKNLTDKNYTELSVICNQNRTKTNDNFIKKCKKAWSTRDSQEVSHPSTNRAQQCLTGQIGRDGVFSLRYDPKRKGLHFFD